MELIVGALVAVMDEDALDRSEVRGRELDEILAARCATL